ncbi:MAG: hypothetical protein RIT45_2706 [Pseudomonadota bacterium]|jgi:AcrR family transcriptional regulator
MQAALAELDPMQSLADVCCRDLPETAQRILLSALQLFAERGFESVSVREICAAAGVSKPVLYYHFESRDGVVRAVIEALERGWHAHCDADLDPTAPSRAALVRFMTGLLELAEGDGLIARILSRFASIPPGLLRSCAHPERFESRMIDWLDRGVAAGAFPPRLDSQAVTWLLLGAFNRLAMLRAVFPTEERAAVVAERLVRAALGPEE